MLQGKALVLVTNGKGQNQEVVEAITAKFAGAKFRQWRVLTVGP